MLTILSVLILASDMAVFYGNYALTIFVLSTKKRFYSFLKTFFVFQKICFKVKVFKMLKTFADCHIRICQSLKRRAISKIPSIVF